MTDVVAARLPHRRQTSEPHRIVAHSSCTRRSEAPSPRARSGVVGGDCVCRETRRLTRGTARVCAQSFRRLFSSITRSAPISSRCDLETIGGGRTPPWARASSLHEWGLPRSQGRKRLSFTIRVGACRDVSTAPAAIKGQVMTPGRMICADAEPCVRQRTMRCVSVNPAKIRPMGRTGQTIWHRFCENVLSLSALTP